MKIKKWIIPIILMVLLGSMLIPVTSIGISEDLDPTGYDKGGNNQVVDYKLPNTSRSIGDMIKHALGVILNFVRIVALGWAIVMLIIIAIKYMVSSPQAKGQLKTDMPTYLIGAVILFGTSGILTLIQFFMQDNFSR